MHNVQDYSVLYDNAVRPVICEGWYLIGKIDTTDKKIYDRSLYWLGTDTSLTSGGVKLVLWVQISTLSEIMRSCKDFPHFNQISTLAYNRANSVIIKNAIILTHWCRICPLRWFTAQNHSAIMQKIISICIIQLKKKKKNQKPIKYFHWKIYS
jgi:hypothetical protein